LPRRAKNFLRPQPQQNNAADESPWLRKLEGKSKNEEGKVKQAVFEDDYKDNNELVTLLSESGQLRSGFAIHFDKQFYAIGCLGS
jgi:hypothetical protein